MQALLKVVVIVFIFGSQHAIGEEITFTDDEKSLLKAFSSWPMKMPADPGNEYSGEQWAEILGEKLFNDVALSADQSISCASCHESDRGFADGSALAIAGAKPHVRNTQGLLNVGYQRWFGWDGGADSLWSASLRPLLSEIEMASDIETLSSRLRDTPYVINALDKHNIKLANLDDESLVVLASKLMGAYMRTLISGETSFDQFVGTLLDDSEDNSSYPLAAQRGMRLFFGEGNCFVCHFGANFSNGEFHDIGRPFFTGVGQVDPGRHSGIQRINNDRYNLAGDFNGTGVEAEILKTRTVKSGQINFGQWRTPSLRNLLVTAPYMHDGSLKTLRDVVDYYAEIDPARLHTKGEAILRPFQWSDVEREDLVVFLKTLSE
ncbi:MAG: cytochrome-c peroxidase [Granulosicoccus sp.]